MNKFGKFNLVLTFLVLAGCNFLLTTIRTEAQSINQIQKTQFYRIQNGRRTGALTPQEYHKLMRTQGHIQSHEVKYRRDGHLDRQERRKLGHMLQKQDYKIHREKSDHQNLSKY